MNHADSNGWTALCVAAHEGHVESVRALPEAEAGLGRALNDGATALFVAAQNGHVETVRALLEAGAEVNHANDEGFTALHLAAECGHLEVVRALLEAEADVDLACNRPARRQREAPRVAHVCTRGMRAAHGHRWWRPLSCAGIR